MSRQRVVSIHGLNTAGDWQTNVSDGLQPHFHYDLVRYDSFRWLGFSKIAAGIGPLITLGYCAFSAILWWAGWWSLRVALLAGIAGLAAFLFMRHLRERTVETIAAALRTPRDEYPPHVVAHSLGTFLLVRALRKYPSLNVGNIVLVGCVISRTFDWGRLKSRFQMVRNEVGGKDPVGRITRIVNFASGDFGDAGREGFAGPLAHSQNSDLQDCPDCRKSIHYDRLAPTRCLVCPETQDQCEALIHDIVFKEHEHSNALNGLHAEPYWVPFFWNINPDKYEKFRRACLDCRQAHDNSDVAGLRIAEAKLAASCWGWTCSALSDRIRWELLERKPGLTAQELRDWIVILTRRLWGEYLRGLGECRKSADQRDLAVTRLAYPPFAMWRVIGSVTL